MLSTRYLLFAIAFTFLTPTLFAERLDCDVPVNFVVEDNDNKIYIYEAEIYIKYERKDLAVYEYFNTNTVNILINNTAVSFTGYIIEENQEFNRLEIKPSNVLNTQIAGSARLLRSTYNGETLTDCDLYLARNRKQDGIHLSARIQIEILHQAASCIRGAICRNLGEITFDDLRNAKDHPYDFGPLSVKKKNNLCENSIRDREMIMNAKNFSSLVSSASQDVNSVYKEGLQSTLNMLVDLALAEVVRKIKHENQGFFKMPDIRHNESWVLTEELEAIDGMFSDLTTLTRTEDVALSHTGLKFIASCGFGLSKAVLHYDKCKVRYGLIEVTDSLTVKIDGVALSLSLAVDYNQKPCRAILQSLRVTKMGKLTIRLLNHRLLSTMVTWLTKIWKNHVVRAVERKMRIVLEAQLDSFNCEKYRP